MQMFRRFIFWAHIEAVQPVPTLNVGCASFHLQATKICQISSESKR